MSKCKACGEEINWKETKNGKMTPVNLDGDPHWATCPNANDFKKRKCVNCEKLKQQIVDIK